MSWRERREGEREQTPLVRILLAGSHLRQGAVTAAPGMLLATIDAIPETRRRQRFISRVHRLRTIGLALGSLSVASVLFQNGAAPVTWVILLINGFLWPHMARAIAGTAADATRAEMRSLIIDSAMGGFWISMMQFNALPCVLLATMLAVDKICVGGWRLLRPALIVQALVCLATLAALWLAYGILPLRPQSTMFNMVASLPLLVAYPLLISTAMHGLGRRVKQQNRELARLTTIDAATGLWNRPIWEKGVLHELRAHQRHGRSAALLMIDIDYFKEINDRHGHPAGDAVIHSVAEAIIASIRDTDSACRYGGDEFGVLLAYTGEHAATVAAERIRLRVAGALIANTPGLRCTLSVGIAPATVDMADQRVWIERADSALYRAKSLGRNQVARVCDDG